MFDIIKPKEVTAEDLTSYKQDWDLIQLVAERHVRASEGMSEWALTAKKCVDYFHGRQWTADEIAKCDDEGRPHLTLNKIRPLIRMICGYHRNNRVDAKFLPDDVGVATEMVAQALTKLDKRTNESNQGSFVDTEVFLDGILTGRGYYDQRLNFDNNIWGEVKTTARDPLTIKVDPDGESYDLNESCAFVSEDRWVSLDEIEFTYGAPAATLLSPWFGNTGYSGGSVLSSLAESITPWRGFGGEFGGANGSQYLGMQAYNSYAYDTARKSALLVDMQHKVKVWRRYIVDMETGDMEPVPDSCDDARLKQMLAWSAAQFAAKGKLSPLRVIKRIGTRIRWTTLVGDIIVYDKWSPYESYTITPFFPMFLRGSTSGAVEDLISPQDEKNKRRSSLIDISTRQAHSGWKYHTSSLSVENKDKLENYGAAPGINIEWQGDASMEPKKIEPSGMPVGIERLEQAADEDFMEISSVNRELMGSDETVKSGRAIEARQRQGVMGIQVYMDNMSRTKELCVRKRLEIYQGHYTEKRSYRIIGDQGKPEILSFNERQASGVIANDLSIGKYRVSIDETPLSASFAAAQFEELKSLVADGIIPKEAVMDEMVDLSSIAHKDAVKKRIQIMQKAQGLPSIEELESGEPIGALQQGPDGQMQPAGQGEAPPPEQPQDASKSMEFLKWEKLVESKTKIVCAQIASKVPTPETSALVAADAGSLAQELGSEAEAEAQQSQQPIQSPEGVVQE